MKVGIKVSLEIYGDDVAASFFWGIHHLLDHEVPPQVDKAVIPQLDSRVGRTGIGPPITNVVFATNFTGTIQPSFTR